MRRDRTAGAAVDRQDVLRARREGDDKDHFGAEEDVTWLAFGTCAALPLRASISMTASAMIHSFPIRR
jgi:hypothetical protein